MPHAMHLDMSPHVRPRQQPFASPRHLEKDVLLLPSRISLPSPFTSRQPIDEPGRRSVCRASSETDRNTSPTKKRKLSDSGPGIREGLPDQGGSTFTLRRHHSSFSSSSPSSSSSSASSVLVAGSKIILGGALAAALAAAAFHLGLQLVESVESVPTLGNLELLLGTVVSAHALSSYLSDPTVRSSVDAKLFAALESLRYSLGLPQNKDLSPLDQSEDPNSTTPTSNANGTDAVFLSSMQPTMLEVELRSLIDASVAAALDSASASTVTVNRKALIEAVADYIRAREQQSVSGHERLRTDLEASEAIRMSLIQLQKSKEARQARRAAKESNLVKLQGILDSSTTLQQGGAPGVSPGSSLDELQCSVNSLSLSNANNENPSSLSSARHEIPPSLSNARHKNPLSSLGSSIEEQEETHAASKGDVDELEIAKERARKFREKLDAMKKKAQHRANTEA